MEPEHAHGLKTLLLEIHAKFPDFASEPDLYGNMPIHTAVFSLGYCEVVRALIDVTPCAVLQAQNFGGWTPTSLLETPRVLFADAFSNAHTVLVQEIRASLQQKCMLSP